LRTVILLRLSGCFLAAGIGFAQPTPFKSYKNQEEYCRENPKMPTCINGAPIDVSTITGVYKPSTAPVRTGSTVRRQSPPDMSPVAPVVPVALQDWRFSHSAPALLVSVNIASLLKSPVWSTMLPQNARAVLGEVGQLLISVEPNGGATPSVLMLAKGYIDGALGSWLRSGAEMQAKRLDAITLLVGDAHSLQFADLRLRSARQTSNLLQQTATREALKYDLWIGVDPKHLPSIAAAYGARSNPTINALSNLRGISLGVYLRDQVRVEALMEAPSAEIAGRMLAAYQEQPRENTQVWKTVEGTQLRYIEISELKQLTESPLFDADTARIIQPQIDRLIRSLAGLTAQPASVVAPKPPSSGLIVIQGLDGGPKQLPAK
jgi:hypothetical protein